MPRFTVKELLLATTLVAISAGLLAFQYRNAGHVFHSIGMKGNLLIWFGGGAFIGAGLFMPFRRPWTGIITAFVLQALLVFFGRSGL